MHLNSVSRLTVWLASSARLLSEYFAVEGNFSCELFLVTCAMTTPLLCHDHSVTAKICSEISESIAGGCVMMTDMSALTSALHED